MNMASGWPLEQLRQTMPTELAHFEMEVLPQIDSTNSELMRRARDGRVAPVLLVAQRQTAGRGRMGRHWFSAVQDSRAPQRVPCLTFSIGLPLMPLDWSGLSLAVGLSIVQSLHPALRLKWPNDVWLEQRKLAGILVETASFGQGRYVVVGVGLNIARPASAGLATEPAWLGELMPDIDAVQTLQRLAAPLMQAIHDFAGQGFAPLQAAFNERDALFGLDVSLSDGTFGVAQGVDRTGALQVRTARDLKRVTSAEVSVRPVGAPPPEEL